MRPLTLLFLLLLYLQAGADSAIFSERPGDVSEPNQSAIIGFDGQREILILGTELSARTAVAKPGKKSKTLRVIPFPSQPKVEKAPAEALQQCVRLTRRLGLYYRFPGLRSTGLRGAPVKVLSQARLGSHDVTVVELKQISEFDAWLRKYFGKERRLAPAELRLIEDYFERGLRYLVLDLVEVSSNSQLVEPLQYTFATDELYYPMRTSNLVGGEGAVELFIFSPYSGLERYIEALVPEEEAFLQVRWRSSEGVFLNSNPLPVDSAELASVSPALGEMFPEGSALQAFRYRGELSFAGDLQVAPVERHAQLAEVFARAPVHRAIFERDYQRLRSYSARELSRDYPGVGAPIQYAVMAGDLRAVDTLGSLLGQVDWLHAQEFMIGGGGETSLEWAIECEEVQVLKLFLDRSKEFSDFEFLLEVCLEAACRIGSLEAVKALLEAGADPYEDWGYAGSAVDVARKHGHRELVQYLESRR